MLVDLQLIDAKSVPMVALYLYIILCHTIFPPWFCIFSKCCLSGLIIELFNKKAMCEKSLLSLIVLLFMAFPAESQKIFKVKYESQADIKVYIVDYESQCDLKVFFVDYESQADEDGLWYMVKYESQADIKVYFVDYESQADLKIFMVKYESQAGWRNPEKSHLLMVPR